MRYALLGAAGYVAPRHMRAIRDTGGSLVAACDPHDSVGILDTYAPACLFFRDPECFFHHLERYPVDVVVICTPNDLHVAHACRGMQVAPSVICEKPLALTECGLDTLADAEERTGSSLHTILQLRLHPVARKLLQRGVGDDEQVKALYLTRRGPWYGRSWKGDRTRSGGLLMNIGVHLFDLLLQLIGQDATGQVEHHDPGNAEGCLRGPSTSVDWRLATRTRGRVRRLIVGKEHYDLTSGFDDLHTESYGRILAGDGFGVEDARPAVRLVEHMSRANLAKAWAA